MYTKKYIQSLISEAFEETLEATGTGSAGGFEAPLFGDMKEDELEGGNSDKKTLEDIIKKHSKKFKNLELAKKEIGKQLKKGMDVEKEHTKKISIAREEQQFIPSQEKNISITIGSYSELVDAMKCILWSLENNPSTIKKIFQHIYIKKDDEEIIIPESDYDITNKIISKAFRDNHFYVQKLQNNGISVWLYNNASNKRLGYFIDGKLRSVEWLSKFYDIPRTTIQSRLKKMNIEQAVKK
jgi:hypothetical protein